VIAESMINECTSQDDRYEHYFGQYTVDMPCGNIRCSICRDSGLLVYLMLLSWCAMLSG